MKIGILTSSRADYSIYLPLLMALKNHKFFNPKIIAFGTHVSPMHGLTKDAIIQDGFEIVYSLPDLVYGDNPEDIAKIMGYTMVEISKLLMVQQFDLLFALGDRFEMFAAVSASVPFTIPIAHIHGGETTEGAIDNVFRHSITSMSKYHFPCSELYARRIREILGNSENIYPIGALSIDNLRSLKFLSKEAFKAKYGLDMNQPSILITVHPETKSLTENEGNIDKLISALEYLKEDYMLIFTMPNADPLGNLIRGKLNQFISKNPSTTYSIESFGTTGYLSCMKHCSFLLGNTSSGFVEASFFPKNVINLGNRQKGRILTANIRTVAYNQAEILDAVKQLNSTPQKESKDIYGDGTAAQQIVNIMDEIIKGSGNF